MHKAERELAKACQKIGKWYPKEAGFQTGEKGFTLKLHGDSMFSPTIGILDGNIVGDLDSYDAILDLLGYECQLERVLFDPEKQTFILDAGWSGKYWLKPTPKDVAGRTELEVDAMATRMPAKITAAAMILIAVVHREGPRRLKQHIKKYMKRVLGKDKKKA